MSIEPLRILAFNTLDGTPIGRMPYTDCKWTDTLNEAGSLSVNVKMSDVAARMNLRQVLRPWRTTLAAVRGDRVVHAGPVTARKWDGATLQLTCGGGWSLMEKRLVLNHALFEQWVNGEVLIDEDNPNPQWVLTLSGSLRGIATGLVIEALKWGKLPIDVPVVEAGVNTRTYRGWDLATTSTRLSELTQVEGGPEIDFQPRITSEGMLRWTLRGDDELVDEHWAWNERLPGQRVMLQDINEDGADMASTVFGVGGKSDDLLLVGRRTLGALTTAGWPVLQVADMTHSSVSDVDTLLGWLGADVSMASQIQESISLNVGAEYAVTPGDWADVRVEDPYLGRDVLALKVVGVSGDVSEWQTVSCRLRED